MHKKGLTQAEIGLTQPENRPNSNFRQVVAYTLQESAEKKTLSKCDTTNCHIRGQSEWLTKSLKLPQNMEVCECDAYDQWMAEHGQPSRTLAS